MNTQDPTVTPENALTIATMGHQNALRIIETLGTPANCGEAVAMLVGTQIALYGMVQNSDELFPPDILDAAKKVFRALTHTDWPVLPPVVGSVMAKAAAEA